MVLTRALSVVLCVLIKLYSLLFCLQNIQHRKYARWKATYIHNCLKSGETPESGPIGMESDMEAGGAR